MENKQEYIEEEITLAELSERFFNNNDFTTPCEFDSKGLDLEIMTKSPEGDEEFKSLTDFVVKEQVDSYYTDGNINVTSNHKFVSYDANGNMIQTSPKDLPEFKLVTEPMKVVDVQVDGEHTYWANGHLNHNTTAGGKAIGFHSSVRLRLKQMGQIKVKTPGNATLVQTAGIKTQAKVVKNRMGPPLTEINYDIYFDSGIDNYGGWLDTLKQYKVVKAAGAWYTYINKDTAEEIKFQSKDFVREVLSKPEVKAQIYKELCDKFILKYTPNVDGGIDDVHIETMDDTEEPMTQD